MTACTGKWRVPGELCEQRCAEMIQSPCTSAAQVPWGKRGWQQGWEGSAYRLRAEAALQNIARASELVGTRLLLRLAGEPKGPRDPPSPSPASDSEKDRRHEPWAQQRPANLHVPVPAPVRVLLGLAPTSPHSQRSLRPPHGAAPCLWSVLSRPHLHVFVRVWPSAQTAWPSPIHHGLAQLSPSFLVSPSRAAHSHSYPLSVPVTHPHLSGTRSVMCLCIRLPCQLGCLPVTDPRA